MGKDPGTEYRPGGCAEERLNSKPSFSIVIALHSLYYMESSKF